MSWTHERTELMKARWADGFSATQIADELGGGITRNAVIGKVHRLNLTGRAKRPATPRVYKPRAARTQPLRTPAVLTPAEFARQQQILAEATEAADLPPDVSRHAVSLTQLTKDTCRWPLGDPQSPGFMFCGALPISTSPYCLRHAPMAYQPASERRARAAYIPKREAA